MWRRLASFRYRLGAVASMSTCFAAVGYTHVTNTNIKEDISDQCITFSPLGGRSFLYDNSVFMGPPMYNMNSWKWLQNNFIPQDNDIFIVSYARTGTTFTQQICHQIMECYYKKTKDENHKYYAPKPDFIPKWYTFGEWIELVRNDADKERKFDQHLEETKNTLRFWKTHQRLRYLPCKKLPKKMIILCRNPKDVIVSLYFFLKGAAGDAVFVKDLDTFFNVFIAGLLPDGLIFEYYQTYWALYQKILKEKDGDTQIYWLYYENLVQDEETKRAEIQKMIEFIGVDDIVGSKEDIDEIIDKTSMKSMKKQYKGFFMKNHIRKGGSGGWKNHLTETQSEIMDALTQVHFNGTNFKYYNELMNPSNNQIY